MKKACQPQCLRFKQIGMLKVGQASLVVNGKPFLDFNVDKRAWRCLDCGAEVWLEAAVDPNLDVVKIDRPKKAGKR